MERTEGRGRGRGSDCAPGDAVRRDERACRDLWMSVCVLAGARGGGGDLWCCKIYFLLSNEQAEALPESFAFYFLFFIEGSFSHIFFFFAVLTPLRMWSLFGW